MGSQITALQSTSVENDLSIKLLNEIFGPSWTSVTEIANTDSLLFELLNDFNKVVLTIVVLSFMWTMAIASANTANEGKPLGEKFSTMWVPIRAMLGVSFLVPVFGGLSMFQVSLLQGVYYSIDVANGANKLVHESLFKEVPSGVISMAEIPGLKEHSLEMGTVFLKALVTQEYYAQKEGISTTGATFTIVDDKTLLTRTAQKIMTFTTPDVENMISTAWMDAVMPTVKISCGAKAGGAQICDKRVDALATYSQQLGKVAYSIVNRSMPEPSESALNNDDQVKSFLAAATQYVANSKNIATEALKGDVGKEVQDKMDKFYNSGASKSGWLALGAYYWVGSNAMSETLQLATDLPKPDEAALSDIANFAWANGDLEAMYAKVGRLIEQADVSKTVLESIDTTDGFLWASGIADMSTSVLTSWMSGKESGKDVITSMQNIGHYIILGCNTLVTTLGAVGLSGINDKDSGSSWIGGIVSKGGLFGKVAGVMGTFLKKFGKLSLAGLLILYPLGFTLAYLLPAVPLIIWVMAVINWAISVLSLIIGSTIWAAAISLPEGDGVAGQHGRDGFMLLANCLLRPFLMVFGFVVSFLLIRFLGGFLQEIFMISSTAMNGQYSRGLVTVIATVGIFGMIVMVAAQKVYGLIVHFPDMILSYVGKNLSGSGEGQDNHKIEGMFQSLGSKGSGFLTSGKKS